MGILSANLDGIGDLAIRDESLNENVVPDVHEETADMLEEVDKLLDNNSMDQSSVGSPKKLSGSTSNS